MAPGESSEREHSRPFEPDDQGESGADMPQSERRPEWLTGAEEGTRGKPEGEEAGAKKPDRVPTGSRAPKRTSSAPPLKLVPNKPAASAAPAPAAPAGGPVAWKAAASSIPRLTQVSAASADIPAEDSFPGFAQDAVIAAPGARGTENAGRRMLSVDSLEGEAPARVASAPPPWIAWVGRLRSVSPLWLIGAGVVMTAVVITLVFRAPPGGTSLAQIRQHPEAFEGRAVEVRGRAGDVFTIGDSYVYDLRQARDTIVVFSRTRRPALHERVLVKGTVSIGYLEGVPRVAILEDAAR